MDTGEKLKALQTSPEMVNVIKLLTAVFIDCELKRHIRFTYTIEGVKYEMNFMPIENEVVYKKELYL